MARKISNETDLNIIRMAKFGYSAMYICKEYDVSESYVKKVVEKNGLRIKNSVKREALINDSNAIVEEYNNGMDIETICKKYGRSKGSVKGTLRSKLGESIIPKAYHKGQLKEELEEPDIEVIEKPRKTLNQMPVEIVNGVRYRIVNELFSEL